MNYKLLARLIDDTLVNLKYEIESQTDEVIITALQERVCDYLILLDQVEIEMEKEEGLERIKNSIK